MNLLLAHHDAALPPPLVLVAWLTHKVGVAFHEAHAVTEHLAGPSARSATIRTVVPAGNVSLVDEVPRHFYAAEGPAGGEFLYLQRLMRGQVGVFAGEQKRLLFDWAEVDAAVLVHAPRRASGRQQ